MNNYKKVAPQGRLTIAISLCILSILSTFLIAYLSNRGEKFWTLSHSVAAGTRLASSDLHLLSMRFPGGSDLYLGADENPVGSIAARNLASGNLLGRSDLTIDESGSYLREISLQVSVVDLPVGLTQGDLISLYQVHDLRNGEMGAPPRLVIENLFLSRIGGGQSTFSGTTSITVSTDERNVEEILAATTSGRIVVVAYHG